MDISNLVLYYRDCYQADARAVMVSNIFARKVEDVCVVAGDDELLNANLPYYPIEETYAEKVKKSLTLYRREKALYCCAFFLIGRREDALGKDAKFCAPVLLYPARVDKKGDFDAISVDFRKRIININFLNSLKQEGMDDLYEAISEAVGFGSLDLGKVSKLRGVLESRIVNCKAEDLLLYPRLTNVNSLKYKLLPKNLLRQQGYSILPATAFCILRRSVSTQGIISELTSIAQQEDYSAPLSYLFDESCSPHAPKLAEGHTPAVLSSAQEGILESVNNHTMTVVQGPPGTGKSFTIAAIAIEFLSKGQSVLVSSKTNTAVDVIYKKITEDFQMRHVALRAGRSDYKRSLKQYLQHLLAATRKKPDADDEIIVHKSKWLRKLDRELAYLTNQFWSRVLKEIKWGEILSRYEYRTTFLTRLKVRYIRWRAGLQVPHWKLTNRYELLNREKVQETREYLSMIFQRQVHHAMYSSRKMFRDFLKSLTARNSSRKDSLFKDIWLEKLLKTFPIWLVNMSDIYDTLPLEKEVFDLAIIDEASQCDIASCLPVLQRAKRVVIIGDKKQLRHASFLSQSVQSTLLKKHGLQGLSGEPKVDYRNTSILDFVDDRITNQIQVAYLDEHYRSKPDIIAFSNKHFYFDSLRIMTAIPGKDQVQHLEVVECNGRRDLSGVNDFEAQEILSRIKALIEEQSTLSVEFAQSIGVLSPFRNQVEYLHSLLSSELELNDMVKHDIMCATAYGFQGSERDVMFLSFAIDEDSHHAASIHINKPDVLNVAITRARARQYVMISFGPGFDSGEYLSRYISDINQSKSSGILASYNRDEFLNEVTEIIRREVADLWIGYTIAGLFIDIVIKIGGKFYGIDLIGFPGPYQDALRVDDYGVLARAGLRTFPLPFTYWKLDRDHCLQELWRFVGRDLDE